MNTWLLKTGCLLNTGGHLDKFVCISKCNEGEGVKVSFSFRIDFQEAEIKKNK